MEKGKKYVYMLHPLSIVLLLLAAYFLRLPSAEAALVGEAELGYVSYDREVNGAKAVDASSFRQRYSLLYSTAGELANGRLGQYRLSLGYEWTSFDTKLKTFVGPQAISDSFSVSAGHILYRGDVRIDPQELPVFARFYSYDLSRSSFSSDAGLPLLQNDALIPPSLTTSLRDGTRILSGFNVDIGNKGGQYNSIFGQLPRIFIDYQDNIIHDLKTLTPEDTRLRRLAFVSLNKKDNWFHVRTTNFTDYLNPTLSYKETQVILGTIDQQMQRRWVDFSNWIKVSADGQYTKHQEMSDSYESYEVDLFGTASRSRWEAKTYNSFRRTIDTYGLTYDTRIPLYVSGTMGADTDWRVRLNMDQSKVRILNNYDTRDFLASYRIDTFKRERFTLMHSGSVESYDDSNGGKTLSLNGHLETTSTRRFSSVYGLFASYDITSARNRSRNAEESSVLTQMFSVKGGYAPTNSLKLDITETVTISNGNAADDLTSVSTSSQPSFVGNESSGFKTPTDSYTRSRAVASASWQPVARLRIGFILTDDLLQARNRPTTHATEFANTIDYTIKSFKVRMNTRYVTYNETNNSHTDFNGDGSIIYSPDRTLESSVQYSYSNTNNTDGTGSRLTSLKQATNYYLYTDYGVTRRILELNQGLEYDEQTYFSYRASTKSLIGGIKYYPLTRLFIAARAKYSLLSHEDATQNIYNATIGFNFNLMQATLDYSYGREHGNGNRLEKRFEANLKKVF
ncbi:hypothetical protein [Geotalea sp. SG265]|uniref:hypothetical protein n=1 Tax=Geotalea sp. SG265 TaxID=2922867 RepID=UPI001FAF19DF|nr:hypothetical protein [Geotalea sp. SG265]